MTALPGHENATAPFWAGEASVRLRHRTALLPRVGRASRAARTRRGACDLGRICRDHPDAGAGPRCVDPAGATALEI
jgi:hypothetical protein